MNHETRRHGKSKVEYHLSGTTILVFAIVREVMGTQQLFLSPLQTNVNMPILIHTEEEEGLPSISKSWKRVTSKSGAWFTPLGVWAKVICIWKEYSAQIGQDCNMEMIYPDMEMIFASSRIRQKNSWLRSNWPPGEFTYTLFYTPPLPEVADETQKRIWR